MGVKEEFLRLLKEDEEFRLAAASLLGYIELIKRLDENEKRIDSTLAEIKKLREDFNREMHNLREEQIKMREEFNRLEHRFEVILGRMGRRWGVDLEKTMLGTFKEVLEKEGIEIGKVESFSYTDYDGSITGLKGRRVQVDILVKNGKLTLIEVKSFPEFEDVDHLRDVVGYVEKILKRSVDQVYLVAVNIDRETLNRAKELGFKVIYGNLVE
ncbi:hypothetical protein B9Q13_05635 [Candidatus Marsarchaeota G2 archaeon ECH_B_SAG-G16]|uniref:Microtubule-binding protein n=1 Tax=Candidatus Marsarchaeota G2 archaeon ECH_B_SAG-G16 TaxID=1978167 RepID=A0A2R6BZN1_9ARCH|nr:MAG: hypothetical protein B9Q13_05635 [Candidatus Marsarchaeota G2 archaeon ECH_B_SAG-G16]